MQERPHQSQVKIIFRPLKPGAESAISDSRSHISIFYRYEIVHKGVEGIVSVTALVELSTFNLNTDYVKQEFSYTHFWTTDNVTEVRELSGNPGYLKGKPLLSGLVTPTEDDKKTFFIDTTTFKHAVSTMSRSSNGECFRNGLDIASENR